MLGPSLLEILLDLVFMEMPKLGLFSLVDSSIVNIMTVASVPNEAI